MGYIFEYILKYGEKTFKEEPFNEIDGLVFANLSYVPLDNIVSKNQEDKLLTIKEANKIFQNSEENKKIVFFKKDILFLDKLAKSKRYRNLKLAKYINNIDENKEEQFSAITIILDSKTIYVSFSGTDITFVGWKENFNMVFMNEIPAQADAKKYLRDISNKFADSKIYIGGHSKGGNLALYSAVTNDYEIQDRIINIFNFDGPGFRREFTLSEGYKRIIDRMISVVPQGSIVGMILEHREGFRIIESGLPGMIQHDLYFWRMENNHFVDVASISKNSLAIYETIHNWMEKMPISLRKKIVSILYTLIRVTNDKTTHDFLRHTIRNIYIVGRTYRKLNKEDRKLIRKTFILIYKALRKNRKMIKIEAKKRKKILMLEYVESQH